MKRPTLFLERLLLDAEVQFGIRVQRDIDLISRRYEKEGMSFLTITLPTFCDSFDESLARGRLAPFPTSFKRYKRRGGYPAFLSGFLRRIFSCDDGCILPTPCIESIRFIRQVCRAFKKILLPCSPGRFNAAFRKYVENDREVLSSDGIPRSSGSFRAVTGYLWSHLEVLSGELYCAPGRHGSGATAEYHSRNGRYDIKQWPIRGDESFPASWFTSYREDHTSCFSELEFIDLDSELPARVVAVPKTLKTPRIICVEPSYMTVRQQSILHPLVEHLESGRAGFQSIRFTDQTVNRRLACEGSLDDSYATIDLSDASDLVSYDLVEYIFKPVCPTFFRMLDDSRTRSSRLPTGETITLKKFASMGSSLCFPVEAMVFMTIVVSAIADTLGGRLHRSTLEDITASISIYGDDIIVPTVYAVPVMAYLEAYGLRVNRSKSFASGFFKESCGGDYYKGHDVTPVYLRRPYWNGASLNTPETLASITSTANQLYKYGYWQAAGYLRDLIQSHLRRKRISLPLSSEDIGGLYFYSHFQNSNRVWNRFSCNYTVKTVVLADKLVEDKVQTLSGAMSLSAHRNGWECSEPGSVPLQDAEKSIRPYTLSQKYRWVDTKSTIW